MSDFLSLLAACFDFLNIDMNIYGFTFSFWDVILFSLVSALLIRLVMGFIAMGGE